MLRRLGRPARFTCADARGRVKKKKGVAPPHSVHSYFHVYTTWKKGRGQRKKAAHGGRRVGGRMRYEVAETGRERRREKDVAKGCRMAYVRFNKGKRSRRRTDEACREGKDVGGEGRNRSLMRWWGKYIR